jgi:hypothetical protein
MTVTMPTSRAARLSLAALTVALATSFALLVPAGHAGQPHPAAMEDPQLSAKAAAFRAAMARLWEDHITWTRMVFVDFAAELPDLNTAETRLLRNQTDIGNAIKPYYGTSSPSSSRAASRAGWPSSGRQRSRSRSRTTRRGRR